MTSFPRETFAARMKRYREYRNMTQITLSNEAGITQGFISKIERGVHVPCVYDAINIARVLGFKLEGLVRNP
jgi:transcriptional regulator with XRE-family HTH domain